jgi:hypothetical protein
MLLAINWVSRQAERAGFTLVMLTHLFTEGVRLIGHWTSLQSYRPSIHA